MGPGLPRAVAEPERTQEQLGASAQTDRDVLKVDLRERGVVGADRRTIAGIPAVQQPRAVGPQAVPAADRHVDDRARVDCAPPGTPPGLTLAERPGPASTTVVTGWRLSIAVYSPVPEYVNTSNSTWPRVPIHAAPALNASGSRYSTDVSGSKKPDVAVVVPAWTTPSSEASPLEVRPSPGVRSTAPIWIVGVRRYWAPTRGAQMGRGHVAQRHAKRTRRPGRYSRRSGR